MAAILHQNLIITGYIDYYCLVCEIYLSNEDDTNNHIDKMEHKTQLSNAQYVQKYRDDHIWKIKNGYYCDFCNVLFPTLTKAGLHTAEAGHNEKKSVQLMTRISDCVITPNNLVIDENAWHGIIGVTCAVCNREFYEVDAHKAQKIHILQLIQKKIEFMNDNAYRKVDDTTFQCLTCNEIFSLDTISLHFNDKEHKVKHDMCRKLMNSTNIEMYSDKLNYEPNVKQDSSQTFMNSLNNDIYKNKLKDGPNTCESESEGEKPPSEAQSVKTKQEINHSAETKDTTQLNRTEILECIQGFQKNGVNINFETESAFCKKCCESIVLDLSTIEKHINEHKNKSKQHFELKSIPFTPIVNKNHHITVLDNKKDTIQYNEPEIKYDNNHNIAIDDVNQKSNKELNGITDVTKCTAENNAICNGTEKPEPVAMKSKYKIVNMEEPRTGNANGATTNTNDVIDEPKKIAKYAKANSMNYNTENPNVFCRICRTKIPSNIQDMKEHVAGLPHANKSNVTSTKPTRENNANHKHIPKSNNTTSYNTKSKCNMKLPMKEIIESKAVLTNMFGFDNVIINDKFWLTMLSYSMITKSTMGRRCQVCEVTLRDYEVNDHMKNKIHEVLLIQTLVLLKFCDEFIREVRPGSFHCGFCNLITDWEDLQKHLACGDHKENKYRASCELKEHMPAVIAHRIEKQLYFRMFNRFGHFF